MLPGLATPEYTKPEAALDNSWPWSSIIGDAATGASGLGARSDAEHSSSASRSNLRLECPSLATPSASTQQQYYPQCFIRGRNIRYVHIPAHLEPVELICSTLRVPPPSALDAFGAHSTPGTSGTSAMACKGEPAKKGMCTSNAQLPADRVRPKMKDRYAHLRADAQKRQASLTRKLSCF